MGWMRLQIQNGEAQRRIFDATDKSTDSSHQCYWGGYGKSTHMSKMQSMGKLSL